MVVAVITRLFLLLFAKGEAYAFTRMA